MDPSGNPGQLCQSSLHSWAPFALMKGLFFPLAGCFTFRSLKQEMKRTSNKRANRAAHISPLSWETGSESH